MSSTTDHIVCSSGAQIQELLNSPASPQVPPAHRTPPESELPARTVAADLSPIPTSATDLTIPPTSSTDLTDECPTRSAPHDRLDNTSALPNHAQLVELLSAPSPAVFTALSGDKNNSIAQPTSQPKKCGGFAQFLARTPADPSPRSTAKIDESNIIDEAACINEDGVKMPPELVRNMFSFIEKQPMRSFLRDDSHVTSLISHFRAALPCPKCKRVHGHTPNGGNNYSAVALSRSSCRSSALQLSLALPNIVQAALLRKYRAKSRHEATNLLKWLSTGKAESKSTSMSKLQSMMDVDFEDPISFPSDEMTITAPILSPQPASLPSPSLAPTFQASISDQLSVTLDQLNLFRRKYEESELKVQAQAQTIAILRREIENLKSQALINDVPMAPSQKSFASVAAFVPANSTLKRFRTSASALKDSPQVTKPVPIELNLSAFTSAPQQNLTRGGNKLCFIFFKGLQRRPPSEYRALLNKLDIASHKVRDILFLSQNLVQFLTYDDASEEIVEKLTSQFPGISHLAKADPTDPALYTELGAVSRSSLETQYFKAVEASVTRFQTMVQTRPILTRSLKFLEKVLETRNVFYETTVPKPRSFLMNSFIDLTSSQASADEHMLEATSSMTENQ